NEQNTKEQSHLWESERIVPTGGAIIGTIIRHQILCVWRDQGIGCAGYPAAPKTLRPLLDLRRFLLLLRDFTEPKRNDHLAGVLERSRLHFQITHNAGSFFF